MIFSNSDLQGVAERENIKYYIRICHIIEVTHYTKIKSDSFAFCLVECEIHLKATVRVRVRIKNVG